MTNISPTFLTPSTTTNPSAPYDRPYGLSGAKDGLKRRCLASSARVYYRHRNFDILLATGRGLAGGVFCDHGLAAVHLGNGYYAGSEARR